MATDSSVLALRIPGTGAWWAAVCGVAQSQTRLTCLSCSSSYCVLKGDFHYSIFQITFSFCQSLPLSQFQSWQMNFLIFLPPHSFQLFVCFTVICISVHSIFSFLNYFHYLLFELGFKLIIYKMLQKNPNELFDYPNIIQKGSV